MLEKNKNPFKEEIATVEKKFRYALKTLPNPDPVLKRLGRDIEVYREIRITDAHIRAVYQQRKLALLSKPWRIVPASESRTDKKVASFVHDVLIDLKLHKRISQMLNAIHYGYFIMENIWEEKEGKWWIVDIRGRPPEWFRFDKDGKLRFMAQTSGVDGEEVPDDKFVVMVYDQEDDNNPYGTPLGAAVYWMWFFKKFDFKAWAVKSEKFGMPLLIGKYPRGTSTQDQERLEDALWDLVEDAIAVIEETMNIDTLESKLAGNADLYESLIRACNSEISKAVLGQTLTVEIGERGSYAATEVHLKVRQDIIESDARMIEEGINDQIIWPLIKYNFGDIYPPQFKIDAKEEGVKLEKARRDTILWNMGVKFPVSYIEKEYGIPRPEDDEEVLPTPGQVRSGMFSENKGVKIEFADKVIKRGKDMDGLYEKAIKKTKKVFGEISNKIKKKIRQIKDEKEFYRILEAFEDTDLKEFADILFNTVFTAYLKGRADVIEDVSKKQFAETTLEPFPFDEAVRFFKEKIPVPPEFFKELEAELKPKFFSISRVEVFDTITEIHSRLLSSLEEGKTFRDFKNEIDEIMLRTGRDPLNPFHLETVFKTNIQQAYGAGLWEQITDPETKHMIAYLRYSAILDERTRPSHAQMHGYTAPPDDPIWKTWFPPNGFNCRCTVETITKWEAEQYKIEPTRDITPPYLEGDFAIDPATAFRSWSEPEMMEILEELEIENENFPPICPSEEFAFDTIKGILKAIIRKKCRPINKIKNPHDLPELFPDVEQFTSLRDAQKYYTERLVESLGGEEKWVFTPIFPVKVEIRNFLKSIILKKDPKRSAYLPLFIKTLKEPNEIWFQTFRDKTGKRKWRLVYIAFFKKFGEKGYMSVIDLRRKGPFAWTAFPANFEYLGKIRGGRLIKTDKGYIRKVGWLIWEK